MGNLFFHSILYYGLSHSKLYYGVLLYCGLVPHHPLFLLRESGFDSC